MNDAAVVGVGDGLADIDQPPKQLAELAALGERRRRLLDFGIGRGGSVERANGLLETFPADQPHGVERLSGGVAVTVDGYDAGMFESSGDFGFAAEPGAAVGVGGQLGLNLFKRHFAAELFVPGEPHFAQTAASEQFQRSKPRRPAVIASGVVGSVSGSIAGSVSSRVSRRGSSRVSRRGAFPDSIAAGSVAGLGRRGAPQRGDGGGGKSFQGVELNGFGERGEAGLFIALMLSEETVEFGEQSVLDTGRRAMLGKRTFERSIVVARGGGGLQQRLGNQLALLAEHQQYLIANGRHHRSQAPTSSKTHRTGIDLPFAPEEPNGH